MCSDPRQKQIMYIIQKMYTTLLIKNNIKQSKREPRAVLQTCPHTSAAPAIITIYLVRV